MNEFVGPFLLSVNANDRFVQSTRIYERVKKKSVTASRGRFPNRGQRNGCKALKSLNFCNETVIQSH